MAKGAGKVEGSRLARTLRTFDLTCLGLNSVIGSGIFLTPGLIAATLGAAAPATYVLAALLCYAIALCFAEMAGMFPGTGGAYVYAREAFGPFTGFLVGWVMWLSALLGGAAVAVAFGSLAQETAERLLIALETPVPAGRGLEVTGTVGIVIALAAANYRGVKEGARSNNILAVAKLAPLVLFALWSLPRLSGPAILGAPPADADLLKGFLLVLYTFIGFEYVPVPGDEVREPQKTIPRALALVLLISVCLYVVVQSAVQSAGLAGARTPLDNAVEGHGAMVVLMALGALASVASVNASIALTGPRCLWALATDGWMPSWLRRLHPAFHSPGRAVVVTAALTLVLSLSGTFEVLAVLSLLASLLQYIPTVFAVMLMRRKGPDLHRPYRIPGGDLVPGLALAVCGLLLVTSEWKYIMGAAGSLVLGAILGSLSLAQELRRET